MADTSTKQTKANTPQVQATEQYLVANTEGNGVIAVEATSVEDAVSKVNTKEKTT